MRTPDFLHRLPCRFRTRSRVSEQRARRGGLFPREGQKEVLGRHIRVAHLPRERVGRVEDAVEFAAEGRRRSTLPRQAAYSPLEPRLQIGKVDAQRLQDRHDDAALLREQGREEMHVLDGGVVRPARREGRIVQGLAGLQRESVVRDHRLFAASKFFRVAYVFFRVASAGVRVEPPPSGRGLPVFMSNPRAVPLRRVRRPLSAGTAG